MNSHDFSADALALHKKLQGKVSSKSKIELTNNDQLSTLYTPGVGAVSSLLSKQPELTREYTIKSDMVAVVSDGSAVLGLGNIGPFGALPVMEGKAMLFAELAGLNAFPIVLDTQAEEDVIKSIKNIAPGFAAINLEDIAAPKCFAIERRLQAELDIPVIHDDQHATAVVVLAGIINALKVVEKQKENTKIVIIGAGAAGNGTARLLVEYGYKEVIVVDSKGILSNGREDLDTEKQHLLAITNPNNIDGDVLLASNGADILVGLSGPGSITPQMIKNMAKNPIVIAMANPEPEILPDLALRAGATVVATGRSDYPNQMNNVLVFPGLFKALITHGVKQINSAIKIKAAEALAGVIDEPSADAILPAVLDPRVVPAIIEGIAKLVE